MDGLQTIVAFAFAAIPGVLVVEMLEFGQPRLRDRNGARSLAGYLIVSAAVWTLATLIFGVDEQLAAAIDAARRGGGAEVAAYTALAWRLALTAFGLGVLVRTCRRALGFVGHFGPRSPFAWDRFLLRMRPRALGQLVHVRLRDGANVYGVLASGGRADFQAEGRGLVLDVELVATDGGLAEVPGSSGVFIAPEVVATVAMLDYETVIGRGRVAE